MEAGKATVSTINGANAVTPSVHSNQFTDSRPDLHGAIFLCSNATFDECMTKKLFGAASDSFESIRHIHEGVPLFLFNYDKKRMFGIFEAASNGALNIDSGAWCQNGGSQTILAAQVRVKLVSNTILSLPDSELTEAITDRIFFEGDASHLYLEMDSNQTNKLKNLFSLRSAGAASRTFAILNTKSDVHRQNENGQTCAEVSRDVQAEKWACSSRQVSNDVNSTGRTLDSLIDLFDRETRHSGVSTGADHDRTVHKRLSLPVSLDGNHHPVYQKESPGEYREKVNTKTFHMAENVASLREQYAHKEDVLKEQREKLWTTLRLDSMRPASGMTDNLERFASLVKEVRQDNIELRYSLDVAMKQTRDLERVLTAVASLNRLWVSIVAELGLMKRDVEELCRPRGA